MPPHNSITKDKLRGKLIFSLFLRNQLKELLGKRHWKLYVSIELLFISIAFLVYRNDILGFFYKGALEVAFWKDNISQFPMNYLQVWALPAYFFRLTIFQFYDLQKLVDFFIFLNSSFLLSVQFIKIINEKTGNNYYSDYFFLPALIGTAILSFNPVFIDLFYKFGVANLAIMNFTIYFFMQSNRSRSRANWILLLLLSSFIFLLSYNSYPLILIFTFSLIILVCMPFAIYTKNKAKFTLSLIILISLIFTLNPSIISIFHVVSLGGNAAQEPLFHVVNLIYYTMNTNNAIISFSGMNTFNVHSFLFYNEVLSLILIVLIFTLFLASAKYRKLKLTKYLISSLVIVEIFNFYAFNGFTVSNYLIYIIVSNHLVTYNHLGIFLTAMDSDRLVLIVYWYLVATLLTLASFSLLKELPNRRKLTTKRRADEKDKFLTRTVHYRVGHQKLIIQIFIVIIVLIFASLQISNYSNNFVDGSLNSEAYHYVSNTADLKYNSYLFFQNINFQSNYVYPITNNPVGSDYGFFQNMNNAFNSPNFKYLYSTFPANTYIYNTSSSPIVSGTQLLNSYTGYINNYNSSNIITGIPAFVIGSQQSYDTYTFENSTNYVNGTGEYITNLSHNSISYHQLSQRELNGINKGYILSLSIHANLDNGHTGSYLVGLAGNSTDLYGYGTNNPFYGVATSMVGNTTYLTAQNTNSSTWHQLQTLPVGKKDTNFTFNIYILQDNTSYQLYYDINNNWYTAPLINNESALRYLTFQAYNINPSNISLNVNISDYQLNNIPRFIPIFYDSYFNNLTSFLQALQNSQRVVFLPHYNLEDLVQSYLVWSGNSTTVEPAAYAINFPNNGWFQVFNSNPPQGSYFGEGIPTSILPIQSGYGDYQGYAESITGNSTILIPTAIKTNEFVSVNLLFSPDGGMIRFHLGSQLININTYSNSSFYKWISFRSINNAANLTIENLNGIQSINVINVYNKSDYLNAMTVINNNLPGKQEINGLLKAENTNYKIYGNYDIASTVNEFAINSPIPEKLITILPADVNYARVVKSNDLNPFIVPAWGNFFGIIFNVGTNENHTIKVLANSSRLDGYFLYTPPFIGLIVALGRISYNRKKKTPAN